VHLGIGANERYRSIALEISDSGISSCSRIPVKACLIHGSNRKNTTVTMCVIKELTISLLTCVSIAGGLADAKAKIQLAFTATLSPYRRFMRRGSLRSPRCGTPAVFRNGSERKHRCVTIDRTDGHTDEHRSLDGGGSSWKLFDWLNVMTSLLIVSSQVLLSKKNNEYSTRNGECTVDIYPAGFNIPFWIPLQHSNYNLFMLRVYPSSISPSIATIAVVRSSSG
jgi:hypothetical protein